MWVMYRVGDHKNNNNKKTIFKKTKTSKWADWWNGFYVESLLNRVGNLRI